MLCKICLKENRKIFKAKIMNEYSIDYFKCDYCGFIQTEDPYWLAEAYKNPINISDTGYIQRNITLSKKLSILLNIFFNINGIYVDYAGGYGVFVRLMRDIGFDYYWDDKFTKNLFAIGFEWKNNLLKNSEAVTAFECFEHFIEPMKEIENMLLISQNIIFTTMIVPFPVPKPEDWWYFGLDHGQHISFYSEKTFKYIAEYYKLNYYHIDFFHILTEKNNISNLKLNILKLSKYGLHNIFIKRLKSRTWSDYILMCSNNKE